MLNDLAMPKNNNESETGGNFQQECRGLIDHSNVKALSGPDHTAGEWYFRARMRHGYRTV